MIRSPRCRMRRASRDSVVLLIKPSPVSHQNRSRPRRHWGSSKRRGSYRQGDVVGGSELFGDLPPGVPGPDNDDRVQAGRSPGRRYSVICRWTTSWERPVATRGTSGSLNGTEAITTCWDLSQPWLVWTTTLGPGSTRSPEMEGDRQREVGGVVAQLVRDLVLAR